LTSALFLGVTGLVVAGLFGAVAYHLVRWNVSVLRHTSFVVRAKERKGRHGVEEGAELAEDSWSDEDEDADEDLMEGGGGDEAAAEEPMSKAEQWRLKVAQNREARMVAERAGQVGRVEVAKSPGAFVPPSPLLWNYGEGDGRRGPSSRGGGREGSRSPPPPREGPRPSEKSCSKGSVVLQPHHHENSPSAHGGMTGRDRRGEGRGHGKPTRVSSRYDLPPTAPTPRLTNFSSPMAMSMPRISTWRTEHSRIERAKQSKRVETRPDASPPSPEARRGDHVRSATAHTP